MKKGRHRRFEEARSLKRAVEGGSRRCAECGAGSEDEHASWCEAEDDEFNEMLGLVNGSSTSSSHADEDDPLADD
ncbi:MAG: hypothetical protein WAM97_17905 [Acidimicrobiales bacterium]